MPGPPKITSAPAERFAACGRQAARSIFAQADDRQPGISHATHPAPGRHDRGQPHRPRRLAEAGIAGVFSYAGRTEAPMAPADPHAGRRLWRGRGAGDYLRAERITHVIDATHPFAAQMSTQCRRGLRRRGRAADRAGARALGARRGRPLDACRRHRGRRRRPGRPAARGVPRHRPAASGGLRGPSRSTTICCGWSIRRRGPCRCPTRSVVARGPFDVAGDRALMQQHGIDIVVAKNAGGEGAWPRSPPRGRWACRW